MFGFGLLTSLGCVWTFIYIFVGLWVGFQLFSFYYATRIKLLGFLEFRSELQRLISKLFCGRKLGV